MGDENERAENEIGNKDMISDYFNWRILIKCGDVLGQILIIAFFAVGLFIFYDLMKEIQKFTAVNVLICAVIGLLFEVLALVMFWIYRSTYERIHDKHYNNEQLALLYQMAAKTKDPAEMYSRIIDSEIKNRAQIAYNQRKESRSG